MGVKKVVILNGNHLCHNPRVIKEARCLAEAGFQVEVLGAWLNEELARRDRELASQQPFTFTPVFTLFSEKAAGRFLLRARRNLAFRARRWAGIELPDGLGYGIRRFVPAARSRDADLYIAHSESMLWVARELAMEGRRIGVDMEDWFSEDLLPEARTVRPLELLKALEGFTLARSVHRTTTSEALANALSQAYGCPAPLAIYNAFPWSDRRFLDHEHRDRRDRDAVSLHWFSQSIGPGRGLEALFTALASLDPGRFEVHLRGELWPANRDWLSRLLPARWTDRIHVHGLVTNEELPSRIAEHDVGLALEPSTPASRDLTVTNKILQYLQAGLAVVATSTAGQREVAAKAPRAVRLVSPDDAASLARELARLEEDRALLSDSRAASLAAAQSTFSWEAMAPRVVDAVSRALQ